MTAVCIVWACPRSAVDGQWCERHQPHADPMNAPALELAQDTAYLLAEGMTLAEIAALT